MLFKNLAASPVLNLEQYVDIDHFRESERYAQAESIPLSAGNFSVLRASLSMPSCVLSLVRTFPRIINGYDMSGRFVVVVPMNDIASARVNGQPIEQSLIVIKGRANCTVYEPEGRLVAILSVRPEALDSKWGEPDTGYGLLVLSPSDLTDLQMLIRSVLEFAAREPAAITFPGILSNMQTTLFSAFDQALRAGTALDRSRRSALPRYKSILDRVDDMLDLNPIDLTSTRLADELGVSVRKLQMATQSVCGVGVHNYSRLKRLWSVRRQLRGGALGLTVRASALAHGFWHMGEFSRSYRLAFGEVPSDTLAGARQGRRGIH